MSARKSFVPASALPNTCRIGADGKLPETASFSANTNNPLHHESQNEKTQNTSQRDKITGTSGLSRAAMIQKQAASVAAISRPGTAAPRHSTDIAAPYPQRTSAFIQPPFLNNSKNTGIFPDMGLGMFNSRPHTSTSDLNSIVNAMSRKNYPESQSFPTGGSFMHSPMIGPQRVLNTDHGDSLAEQIESSPLKDNRSYTSQKKRSRSDYDDEEDGERSTTREPSYKRYKTSHTIEKTPERDFSPRRNEPSSSSRRSTAIINGSRERRETYMPRDSPSPSMNGLGGKQAKNESFLEEALGMDLDSIVVAYKEILRTDKPKWENCTDDEWIAGGERIMEEYKKIFDEMKESRMELTNAFKAIHATGDKYIHEVERRKENLVAVRRRITEATSNVFS